MVKLKIVRGFPRVMQTKALAGAETAMVEAKRMVDAVLNLSRPASIREAAGPITREYPMPLMRP